MLNLRDEFDLSQAVEGVLVTSKQYQLYKRTLQTEKRIKHYINHELNKAYKEADRIKEISYRIGFEEGLISVLACFDNFLNQESQLVENIAYEINKKIEGVLNNFFDCDVTVMKIFKKSIEDYEFLNDTAKSKVQIFLPMSKKGHDKLLRKINTLSASNRINIHFHESEQYIIRKDDQMITFDKKEKTEGLKQISNYYLQSCNKIERFKDEVKQEFINNLLHFDQDRMSDDN